MKIIKLTFVIFLSLTKFGNAVADESFEEWKINFKKFAISQGISEKTLNHHINKSKFLADVIKYDRYQPEFY